MPCCFTAPTISSVACCFMVSACSGAASDTRGCHFWRIV
jgi:hypothetical protein